jgi:hypothetical protein
MQTIPITPTRSAIIVAAQDESVGAEAIGAAAMTVCVTVAEDGAIVPSASNVAVIE